MLKGIIFDFDGVIAESIKIKSNAFKYLYKSYGDEVVKEVIKYHENNGGMSRYEKIKYYHEILLNIKIEEQKILDLGKEFSSFVIQKVIEAPYVPGVLSYIKKSYKKYKLFISTGTPTEEMQDILVGKRIENYFTDVYGSPSNKLEHIKKIKSIYSLKSDELIFYGDSFTDIDAARKGGIPFVLIKNKYNDNLLKSYNGKTINNFIGL